MKLFIKPLRKDPEIIGSDQLDDFIDTVFGNILDLREQSRRLLERMYIRQREQAPVIQRIGDIVLAAVVGFQLPYSIYLGHLAVAEQRIKDELEHNAKFRRFIEVSCQYSNYC